MKLIIILGYTLTVDCLISPILRSRLDKGISLYQSNDEFLVCGKGPPQNIAQARCEKTTEAEAMKQYLMACGIPADKIFKEDQSTTTFGNAFYSYWNFLRVQEPKPIIIVSNQFHAPLVKYSFDKVFGHRYPYTFHAANDACPRAELHQLKQWKLIINEMVETCYPKLFEGVENGDIQRLKSVVDGPRNLNFESCVRNLLNLEDSVDIAIV
jgi:uncharacterized SAM-binding protein YcdF (DUF218 family)